MKQVARSRTFLPSLPFYLGVACSLLAACGATTRNPRQDDHAGSGASATTGADGHGGATAQAGTKPAAGGVMTEPGAPPDLAGAPTFDVEIPPEAEPACRDYSSFVVALTREQQEQPPESGAPGEPGSGGAGPGWGPCGACIATCSLAPAESCTPQEDCVKRHCTCPGCAESELLMGNFCHCAASCMGSADQHCLEPWLDYVTCVEAACVGVCLLGT